MNLILPILIVLPFLGALLLLFIDKRFWHRLMVLISFATLVLSAAVIYLADTNGFASVAFSAAYVPQLNLSMNFGVNQVSLILLIMTSIVFFAASLVSKYFIKERQRIYNLIFLVAEGASFAVFLSANLLLFYIFWEVAEIMMFFIIFLYGGYNRRYASIKFLIYSLFSSLLLLIGIIILYSSITPHSFNISDIAAGAATIPLPTQLLVLVLFLVSFMIKMPIFPFHSWLPDAHTEAPTPGSMILAGVLLKFGGYGLYLLLIILPITAVYSSSIILLFVFSAIYSSIVALRQTNIKRMIAYTSITDMGIVGVGLFASNVLGTQGAIYAMLSHGIAISLLFLVAGSLDEIYGTLELDKIKGVIKNFPGISYLFIIGVFALVGIPLTAGFIADILLFFGSFSTFGLLGVLPLVGILMVGVTLFWAIERSFLSPVNTTTPYNHLSNIVMVSGVFLLASTIIFGIAPFLLLNGV